MRTCGPSQVKLAMCGGTVSQMWYGVGGITGESTVVTTGVDNTTTTPIFLHIGKQDNFKSLPDAWTSDWNKTHRADIPNGFSPSAGAISKIYYQEQAFSVIFVVAEHRIRLLINYFRSCSEMSVSCKIAEKH